MLLDLSLRGCLAPPTHTLPPLKLVLMTRLLLVGIKDAGVKPPKSPGVHPSHPDKGGNESSPLSQERPLSAEERSKTETKGQEKE